MDWPISFVNISIWDVMFMGGTEHTSSNCLLIYGIGVLLGTSSVVALMICTSLWVFCCISRNFAFGGRSVTLLMDRASMSCLMFGLIKAPWLPHKMRERMRQMRVPCVVSSAPPSQLVVSARSIP